MRRIHVIARATLERQEDGSIIMELDREVLRKAQWYDGDEVCISLFRGKCLNVILASEVDSMNERTWEHSGTGGTDRFERGF